MSSKRKAPKWEEACPASTVPNSTRGGDSPLPHDSAASPHETIRKSEKQKAVPSKTKKKRSSIDLTGCGSDSSASHRISKRIRHSAKMAAKQTAMAQGSNSVPTPAIVLKRPASGSIMHVHDSSSKVSNPGESYKPPQVDNAEDMGINDKTCGTVENYYMLPEESAATYIRSEKSTTTGDRASPSQPARNTSQPPTSTSTGHPAPADLQEKLPKPEAAGNDVPTTPKQKTIKGEKSYIQQSLPPPAARMTGPLSLSHKINLAREYGEAFGLADHDAYQQLLVQDWDVDRAALVFLERGAREREERKEGRVQTAAPAPAPAPAPAV